MQIEVLKTGDLTPYARNARTHSEAQVSQIAASIKEFGFNNPVLIDETGSIIAGHGRVLAAQKLALKEVPCIRLSHLSPTQRKAYVLADNRLALNAGWNEAMLSLELAELKDADFDLALIGFDEMELEKLTAAPTNEGLTDPDEVPEAPEEPVTKLGDIWQLGSHRLMCGDSTDLATVERLMDGKKADMVFTDPPYGISIVSGNKAGGGGPVKFGKVGGRKIVDSTNYVAFENDDSTDTARKAVEITDKLGIKNKIIWGGNYFTDFLPPSMCWLIWDKENTGNFADVEMAWTSFDKAARLYKWLWNDMSRAGDRKTEGKKRVHPTQKPVGLFENIFKDFEAKAILDLFGGSGSTLIACEKTGKDCHAMEFSPHCCDVIIKRWEDFTGKKAELTNAR